MNEEPIQPRWSALLPTQWTPAQADAVYEFLSLLADAIFCEYERPLIELARREAMGPPPYETDEAPHIPGDDDDDPIPF